MKGLALFFNSERKGKMIINEDLVVYVSQLPKLLLFLLMWTVRSGLCFVTLLQCVQSLGNPRVY